MSALDERLKRQLLALKLHQILEHYPAVATQVFGLKSLSQFLDFSCLVLPRPAPDVH